MKPQTLVFFFAVISFSACTRTNENAGPGSASAITAANPQLNSIIVTASTSRSGNLTRGFCWSPSNPNPTIDSATFIRDSGTAKEYTDTIKNLHYATQYFVRSFVSQENNVVYGPTDTISTLSSPFYVAQIVKGGYIVYIDSSGEHGLIAAGVVSHGSWETYPEIVAYGMNSIKTSDEIGSGDANTRILLAAGFNDPAGAAGYCDGLVYEGFDDWFLPSYADLAQLMYATDQSWSMAQYYPGNLYWTSSDAGGNQAFCLCIVCKASFVTDSKDEDHGVVAFRKF